MISFLLAYYNTAVEVLQAFLTPDRINGLFEICAAFFILNHCRAAWHSKQAHGISMLSTVFFFGWGLWNIFYYPHLGQMFSFYAGIAVVTANFCWIMTIWHIRRTHPLVIA